MAKTKNRPPTPVTTGNDPELDPGSADPSIQDSAAVDSLLDQVLGDESSSDTAPSPEPTTPSAGDPPPAEPAVVSPNDGKPPTGPRSEPPLAQPEPVQEPAKPEQPHDAEIDGIKEPQGMNPANQQNFKNLREVARKYKDLANQHYSEAEEFKKQVGQIPENIKKELEEHRAYRRMFDITNDQEFKDKFDKPSGEAQDEIFKLLKDHGGTDEHIKMLKDKGVASIPDKWWEENVFKPLRESDNPNENTAGIIIKQRLEKIRSLQYERQREVEKASGSQSEFLKKKDEDAKAKEVADLSVIQKRVQEVQSQIPWAQIREVPKNATPEQRAQIEADNKFYRETVEPAFIVALNPQNAQQKVETALAACLSFRLHKDLAEERETVKQLRAEVSRYKGANIIKPSATATTNPKPANPTDRMKMRNEDAIEAGMNEAGIL
jgi:hypothetical protein